MALPSIFDDRSAFYLWKFIIERNIGTAGLLNVYLVGVLMEKMVDYRRLEDFGDVINL